MNKLTKLPSQKDFQGRQRIQCLLFKVAIKSIYFKTDATPLKNNAAKISLKSYIYYA